MSDEPISAEVMAQIRKRAGWDVNGIPHYHWITGPHAQVYADRGSLLYHVSVLERKISDLEGKLKQRDEALERFKEGHDNLNEYQREAMRNTQNLIADGIINGGAHGWQPYKWEHVNTYTFPVFIASVCRGDSTTVAAGTSQAEAVERLREIVATQSGIHPSHPVMRWGKLGGGKVSCGCMDCGAVDTNHEGALVLSQPCTKRKA